MALSCIVSEIKRDVGRKSRFLHIPAFDAPIRDPHRIPIIAIPFGTEKNRMVRLDDASSLL